MASLHQTVTMRHRRGVPPLPGETGPTWADLAAVIAATSVTTVALAALAVLVVVPLTVDALWTLLTWAGLL